VCGRIDHHPSIIYHHALDHGGVNGRGTNFRASSMFAVPFSGFVLPGCAVPAKNPNKSKGFWWAQQGLNL
jgi:hypothetical protein